MQFLYDSPLQEEDIGNLQEPHMSMVSILGFHFGSAGVPLFSSPFSVNTHAVFSPGVPGFVKNAVPPFSFGGTIRPLAYVGIPDCPKYGDTEITALGPRVPAGAPGVLSQPTIHPPPAPGVVVARDLPPVIP